MTLSSIWPQATLFSERWIWWSWVTDGILTFYENVTPWSPYLDVFNGMTISLKTPGEGMLIIPVWRSRLGPSTLVTSVEQPCQLSSAAHHPWCSGLGPTVCLGDTATYIFVTLNANDLIVEPSGFCSSGLDGLCGWSFNSQQCPQDIV
jgi:hypothetical protein